MFAHMKPLFKYCSKWKTACILIVLCMMFVLLKFCSSKQLFYSKEMPSETPEPKVVEGVSARIETINQYVELLGVIHARHATLLTAKGAGMLDILKASGERVKKGDLLAKIINPDVEKKLNLSLSTVDLAKKQLSPLMPLVGKGIVSALEFNQKKQLLINAKKDLSGVRMELDNLRFYAPFDGIVGVYKKREGTQILSGEGVVSLYDPSSLLVDFDIPCHQFPRVHAGQLVYIQGRSYPLSHVQKMIDEDSAMCPADVDVRCENCLVGEVINVKLATAQHDHALVIPFTAVFLKNSKPAVYIVESGKIALRIVALGIRDKDRVEVTSGLQVNDQVIVKGQERLYPGVAVRISEPKTAQYERVAHGAINWS